MKRPIYLDYNATTPCDPRVVAAILPYFTEKFGNAASFSHLYGWEANAAVDQARETIANALHATDPKEIIFTSGATEANNLAILGVASARQGERPHFITQKTEHKCVLDACKEVERLGATVTYLDVDAHGRVDPDDVKRALTTRTVLVSIMTANNEIGTVQPIRNIARVVHEHSSALFHTDAAQAFGKLPIDAKTNDIDLLSASGHKIYGPKGIGFLYIKKRHPEIRLHPLIHGGGQEGGLRSGTLAVPLIVGFGKAIELALSEMGTEGARLTRLRNQLIAALTVLPDVRLNGHPTERLPNNINVSIEGINGEALMAGLHELAVSSSSACASGALEPSYVLKAIGVSDDVAKASIRIGIGRWTTEEEVNKTIAIVTQVVKQLKSIL